MSDLLATLQDDMNKVIDSLKRELMGVRTGRASPQLVENVQVHVQSYGSNMPLNNLANITAPDARLLIVNPWDKSTIGDIERAIATAGLGFNPSNDGQVIRIPIPPLTGERRQQLVKVVKKEAEEAKVRARAVRRDYNDMIKVSFDDKDITEDEQKRMMDKVQTATDGTVKKIDEVTAAKEREVLEV